jgi:hypothetical protein
MAEEVFKSIMNNGFRPSTNGSYARNQTENDSFLKTIG